MVGEVTSDIRSLITGSKRPTKALDRYLSNIANAGTFGLALDLWESAKFDFIRGQLHMDKETKCQILKKICSKIKPKDFNFYFGLFFICY